MKNATGDPVRIRLFTICTDAQHQNLLRLQRSLARHGFPPLQVVVTDKPLGDKRFGTKLLETYPFLQGCDPDDIVIYMDGYDVLACGEYGRLRRYVEDLARQHADFVLFGAETVCYPEAERCVDYARRFGPAPSRYAYLCAGAWLGRVRTLLAALEDYMPYVGTHTDDQRLLTTWLLDADRGRHGMLDRGCAVFQNLLGAQEDLECLDGTWHNSNTNSCPVLFHGNGTSKDVLFDVIGPGAGC